MAVAVPTYPPSTARIRTVYLPGDQPPTKRRTPRPNTTPASVPSVPVLPMPGGYEQPPLPAPTD